MHFQKEDLEGTRYSWSPGDQNTFLGQPGHRSFNRYDGDQVLFIINFYGSVADRFTITEGKKITAFSLSIIFNSSAVHSCMIQRFDFVSPKKYAIFIEIR